MGGNGAEFNINGKKFSMPKGFKLNVWAGMKLSDCKTFEEKAEFFAVNRNNEGLKGQIEPEEIEAYLEQKLKEMEANAQKAPKAPQKTYVVPQKIAQMLYNDIKGAGTSKNFSSHLNSIKKDNAADIVLQYNNISSKSLAYDILSEFGTSKETRLKYIDKIFNELFAKADELKIDVNQYKVAYKTARFQVDKFSELEFKNDIFDEALNGLAAAINGKSELTAEDKTEAANLTKNETVSYLEDVVNGAESNKLDVKKSSWSIKVVDWMSQAWSQNFDRRSERIDEDIENFKKDQINSLKTCKTEAAFKEEFKRIYGVEYDKELISAYNQRKGQLVEVEAVHFVEDLFNKEMSLLLKSPALKEEVTHVGHTSYDVGGDYVKATKEQVYNREFDKLVQFLDITLAGTENEGKGKTILENALAKYSTMEEKYAKMHEIAKEMSTDFNEKVNDATDGKGYNAFVKESDAMYDAAFGIKNNIARRVEKYNIQQQTGAMIFKGGAKILGTVGLAAVTVATGGLGGLGTVAVAGGTTVISAAVDISDGLSSEKGLRPEEIEKYLSDAIINGASVLAGGGIGKALSNTSTFVKIGGQMIGDVAVGAGAEYVQTGEITIGGIAFQCVFSAVGSLVSIKPKGSAKGANGTANSNAAQGSGHVSNTKPTGKAQTGKTNVANSPDVRTEIRKINGQEYEFDVYTDPKTGRDVIDLSHPKKIDGEEVVYIELQEDVMCSTGVIPEGIQNTYSSNSIEKVSRYLLDKGLNHNTYMKAIDEISVQIKNGEVPSWNMLQQKAREISGGHNVDEVTNNLMLSLKKIDELKMFFEKPYFVKGKGISKDSPTYKKDFTKFQTQLNNVQMQNSNAPVESVPKAPVAEEPKAVNVEKSQKTGPIDESKPVNSEKPQNANPVNEPQKKNIFSEPETVPLTEDEIAYNSVIEELSRRQANNEPITLSELDNILENTPNIDHRRLNVIREQVLHDANVKSYLDANLHMSIIDNPKCKVLSTEEMDDVIAVYNNILKTKIDSPEDLGTMLNNHKYQIDMSQNEIDAISDILRSDPIMQQKLGPELVDIVLFKYFF